MVFIFIAVFSLNLLSEGVEGICREGSDSKELSQSLGYKPELSLVSKDSSTNQSEPASAAHVCHLGHCAHVVISSRSLIPNQIFPITSQWQAKFLPALWRDLDPLLRPPIA